MNIKLTKIGRILLGADGIDEYVLLRRSDDDMTAEQAKEWLLPQVYRRGGAAGSYFCVSVSAVMAERSNDTCICIIHHRYDV